MMATLGLLLTLTIIGFFDAVAARDYVAAAMLGASAAIAAALVTVKALT